LCLTLNKILKRETEKSERKEIRTTVIKMNVTLYYDIDISCDCTYSEAKSHFVQKKNEFKSQ